MTKSEDKVKRPRGSGSYFLRGKYYYVKFYRDGRPIVEPTHTDNESKAQRILKKQLAAVDNGTYMTITERKVRVGELVSDLLAWYRTTGKKPEFADDAESRWNNHLKPFFEFIRASQLCTDDMRKYRQQRTQDGASQTTVNRELQILRKAYKLASVSSPPKVRTVPKFEMASEKDNPRRVFMTPEIVDKLKIAASKEGLWMRVFVEMIFTLGWRKSEVLGLRVHNVYLAENFIRIEHTKTGEPREAPLTEALRVLLEPLVIGKQAYEPLFPVKDVRYAWKRICKAAGVTAGREGFIIHDARRTTARTMRSAGVDESVTMALLGWETSAMFKRYGIVNRADTAEALKRSAQYEARVREESSKKDGAHYGVRSGGVAA